MLLRFFYFAGKCYVLIVSLSNEPLRVTKTAPKELKTWLSVTVDASIDDDLVLKCLY